MYVMFTSGEGREIRRIREEEKWNSRREEIRGGESLLSQCSWSIIYHASVVEVGDGCQQ